MYFMEKNKRTKALWTTCLIIVIIAAIVTLNHLFDIITLPDILIRIVGVLNICALIGLGYSYFKAMKEK